VGERNRLRGDGVQERRAATAAFAEQDPEHQDTQQEITDVVSAPQQDAMSRAEPLKSTGLGLALG